MPAERREWDHLCPGRTLWRVVVVCKGWHSRLRLQLPRVARFSIASTKPLAPGKATIKFDFTYDGGGPGKGGTGRLFVNGEKVAEGRIELTQPGMFSADETADVGIDLGTPVVEAIGSEAKSRFTGRIHESDSRSEAHGVPDKAEEERSALQPRIRKPYQIRSGLAPGKAKESNWLPAPDGPIYLAMRMYWPKPEAPSIQLPGEGSWQPPGIQQVK